MTDEILEKEESVEGNAPRNLANVSASELADSIYEILDNKKARDIKILHVEKKTILADYFVLCTGNSSTQVKALADEVEYKTGLYGRPPKNVEGKGNISWIVLDFDNVIVHVFSREARDYYNLDKLYSGTIEIKTTEQE